MTDPYTDKDLKDKTEAHDKFNDTLWEYRAAAIIPHIKARPILDIGCGPGRLLKRLAELRPNDLIQQTSLYGVEPDYHDAVDAMMALPRAKITECKFEDFKTDIRFGTIIASHVLEHVDDPRAFIKKCRELLVPTGTLIVTVPNAHALHKRLGAIMGLGEIRKLSGTDQREGHQHTFSKTDLKFIMMPLGFYIHKIEGIMLKPLPSAMMQEVLSREFADAFNELGKDPALIDYCSSLMVVARRRG